MPCFNKTTNWLWSAVSALLLFVVAAHAVEPLRADRQPVRGSAFSASTVEVSLKAPARTAVVKELIGHEPASPPQPVDNPAENASVVGPVGAGTRRAIARGADPALHPLSPRAPPLA